MGDVLSGEFEKHHLVRVSHLTGQMQNGLSPNPYTSRKSKHAILYVCSFSVSEVFAVAKVKLCDTQ